MSAGCRGRSSPAPSAAGELADTSRIVRTESVMAMSLFRSLGGVALGIVLLAGGADAGRSEPALRARVDGDGVQRVSLIGGSYFFRPAYIIARAGLPLELGLSMEPGIVPHSFVLEGPDGKRLAEVELDETVQSLRLNLAPGNYPFYCPNRLLFFRSHREKGMAGRLAIVE